MRGPMTTVTSSGRWLLSRTNGKNWSYLIERALGSTLLREMLDQRTLTSDALLSWPVGENCLA